MLVPPLHMPPGHSRTLGPPWHRPCIPVVPNRLGPIVATSRPKQHLPFARPIPKGGHTTAPTNTPIRPYRPNLPRPNTTNFPPQFDALRTRFPATPARCIALYAIEGLAATWVLKNAKTTAYTPHSEPYRPLWPTCQLAPQNRPPPNLDVAHEPRA